MEETIAIVDASVVDTPAERTLTRELDAATTVYEASEGQFPLPPGDIGNFNQSVSE